MEHKIDGLGNISEEFSRVKLGDRRLDRRLKKIVDAVGSQPGEGFPDILGSRGELEAMYRFVSNDRVNIGKLLQPHFESTAKRLVESGEGIIIHDTSTFCFSGGSRREGLCRITNDKQGFFGHFALAVSGGEVSHPLGVIGLKTFIRTGDKGRRVSQQIVNDPNRESLRWLQLVKESEERIGGQVRPIHVMDRQADFYELLGLLDKNQYRFVIRMSHDRKLAGTEEFRKIYQKLEATEYVCEREVPLSKRKKSKALGNLRANPPRNYRLAQLAFSATAVEVLGPTYLHGTYGKSLKLNVVHVRELNVPADCEPVDWKIISQEPIKTSDQILQIVDTYRKRWVIEEYFKALKTGCAYESRQLESDGTLLNALGIFIPIAWRVLLLRSVARDCPDSPAIAALDETKIQVLKACSKIPVPESLTAKDALLAVAAMGGHIKNNGSPGWQVLWRGYKKLLLLEQGWLAARSNM